MKERGKAVEASNGYNESDYSYFSSDLQCKKHPSSNSGGICAYCLKDRLIKLVCSDCGEQRLSSCSCSDVSPYRNSCSTVEVGSVGRISFLIENEKTETQSSNSKSKKGEKTEQFVLLKRSNSSCVEVKRSNGFWRIGRLFRKKREKVGFDDKSDMWVSDYTGVSRSRSLCSFRVGGGGGGVNDPDHEGSDFAFSSAKISDVNGIPPLDSSETEARKSGFKGLLDGESCSSVQRSVFGVKESDFSKMDESGFIDLKLDLSSESKIDCSAMKMSEVPIPIPISVSNFGSLREEGFVRNQESGGGGGFFGNGGSCRITVNERGIKKGNKGHNKVWKWIFKQNPGWRSASKKDGGYHM
ncbi:hypothetical protein LguiA_032526 [Lonicera macranthoides]